MHQSSILDTRLCVQQEMRKHVKHPLYEWLNTGSLVMFEITVCRRKHIDKEDFTVQLLSCCAGK